MATQTIQFRSPPSQTVTLRLFVAGSDTQIASAAATEATNRKGTYTAAFTDVPAAEYQYIATIGTSPIIPVASGYVLLTLTTATFQTYDAAKAVNLSEVPTVDSGTIQTAAEAALEAYDAATAADVAAIPTVDTVAQLTTAGLVENVNGKRFTGKAVEVLDIPTVSEIATEIERSDGLLNTLVEKFTGITFLRNWFGVLFGNAADAPTLAEVNATTAAATYNNAQHSLQAQRDNADTAWTNTQQAIQDLQDHGDETWTDAGTLAQEVVFSATVMDDLTELPVNGVQMTVAGRTRFTGTDGTVVLRLNPGTYQLAAIAPPDYASIDDIEFTVPEVDVGPVAVPVQLSRVPIEIPTGAPVCMCTIIAIDQHGDPAVAANIVATTSSKGISDGELFVFNVERPFDTDDRGYAVMPLLRNQRYEITVEYGDFGSTTVKRTIPDAPTYRITVQL